MAEYSVVRLFILNRAWKSALGMDRSRFGTHQSRSWGSEPSPRRDRLDGGCAPVRSLGSFVGVIGGRALLDRSPLFAPFGHFLYSRFSDSEHLNQLPFQVA